MTKDEYFESFDHLQEDRYCKGSSSLEKFAGRIKLDTDWNYGSISNPKSDKNKSQYTDRANRAVAEQVLDPRTRMILLKLINRNVFYEINGCISTGKEANVYHAATDHGAKHLAVKIYKSTILTFKARDQYVTGEYRFRQGYSKSNPRKMVQVWAEKEMRNLRRLNAAGIPSPVPHHLKLHVLIMDLIGDSVRGIPAPRLKDANIEDEELLGQLYNQAIRILRKLYQECRLVHADFSEYNILLHERQLVVIDVSQSVEHDHPRAIDFLRHDCTNILKFFRQRHLRTLSLQQLFEFVTNTQNLLTEDLISNYLEQAHGQTVFDSPDYLDESTRKEAMFTAMSEEAVFRNAYIPRTLSQVTNIERDIERFESGETDDILYAKLLTSTPVLEAAFQELSVKGRNGGKVRRGGKGRKGGEDERGEEDRKDQQLNGDSSSESFESQSEDTDSQEESDQNDIVDKETKSKDDIRTERKANKKLVKEEKRERRKHKVKKHVKRRQGKECREPKP